jgi:TonB family protein
MTTFRLFYSVPAVAVVLLWTETSAAAQKPQREPERVASDVQEAKLIKRVEPMYPQQARWLPVHGPVRLQVVVNERGEVAEAKIIGGGNPLIQRPALEAVRQWRYFPTYMNGEAVPVSTTVEMPFSYPGSGSAVYMMVDETGNLRTAEIDAENKWKIAEEPLPPARMKEIKGPVFLMVAPGVPLTILEESAKALQDSGLSNFCFLGRGYVFRSGRLYGVGNANGI